MQFRNPTKIEKYYLVELGRIVIAMSSLESELRQLLRTIVPIPSFTDLLVTGMQMERTLAVLSAAFYSSTKKDTESETFEYLRHRIEQVHSKRNDNIHAQWFFPPERFAIRYKVGKQQKGRLPMDKTKFDFPIDELEKFVEEIHALIDDIIIFRLVVFYIDEAEKPVKDFQNLRDIYDNNLKSKALQWKGGGKKRAKSRKALAHLSMKQ
jgi:hypothetical protein